VLGFGVLGFVQDFIWRYKYSMPADLGIALGNGAIAIIGAVTLVIANCLNDLDQRLRRLENNQAGKNNGG
jgi:hypothetical protein